MTATNHGTCCEHSESRHIAPSLGGLTGYWGCMDCTGPFAQHCFAARPAQEATPPREQEQHQGWTNDQTQEPVLQRFTSVAQREAYERLRSRINVSKAIIARRMELDMTQAEIADRAGTKQSRISEMEQLAGNVRFDTLERVAEALGLMVTLVPRTDASRVDSVPAVDPKC